MQNPHRTVPFPGLLATALALAAFPMAHAQAAHPAITLAKSAPGGSAANETLVKSGSEPVSRLRAPSLPFAQDYRDFGRVNLKQSSGPQLFTLTFHETTTVTNISATADFHVSGGTCIAGVTYSDGDLCSVEVVLTPQGPGHRTGKIVVAHSASAQPFVVPTGGTAYGPAVGFIPAQITTLASTYPGSVGLLQVPQGLTVDGGDNLYIADSGNNLVRYQDSSGTLLTLAGGGTVSNGNFSGAASSVILNSPYGVAVDNIGNAYISDTGNAVVRVVDIIEQIAPAIGSGAGPLSSCTVPAPCVANAVSIPSPYGLALDYSGNVFVNVNSGDTSGGITHGAFPLQSTAAGLSVLSTEIEAATFTYPLAVDPYEDLYYAWNYPAGAVVGVPAQCYILGQNSAYSTGSAGKRTWIVAGTRNCGFSGDGGPAAGAEISSKVQGFAWDAAGNFYFTDTGNQRVRRIDVATGVIHTIAGNGISGYVGDGGPATAAAINGPTGIAVDSHGSVYTTGLVTTTGQAVVRKIGGMGALTFAAQAISTHSPVQTIQLANTGNNTLTFAHFGVTSGNNGDFAIDPTTTTCLTTVPVYAGQNCLIGIIFTPPALGARSAVLTVADNTVSGSNLIQLSGTGATAAKAVVSPTSLTFASQPVGTSSPPQPVTLSNTGGVPFSINSYTFTGANAGDFSQTNNCAATLAAGGNCTINVVFTPAAAGTPTATLSVSTTGGTVTVSLHGTAPVKPTVTLTSNANPSVAGKPIVLSSKVAGASSTVPTGKVQLKEGNKVLAEATLSASAVTFKLGNLSIGTHVLAAWYLGDKHYSPSESGTIKQIVKP